MIQLDRVKRQFGPRILFEGLSWLIPRGARLGLVGPNGIGKTTLLRILAGIERADDGALHKPRSCRIGYLPQEVETIEQGSVLAVVLAGFPEISDLERRLERLEQEMAAVPEEDPRQAGLTREYGELRHRYEALEGDRLESRARTILSGLGIAEASFHTALETLSGGWRMRVVLARLLLGTPDLLLLDEPTNHLDLEAISWLEGFLEGFEGAFVVVSHDRYFLNRMVRGIVELDRGEITDYVGNYDDYIDAKRLREEQLEQTAKRQAREIARVERFIERFRYKNTKAKQVQSRIRSLDKMDRVQTAAASRSIRFGFPAAPRSGDVVVRAEGLHKRYGSNVVYDGLDLLLRRGERMALVGPNGAGKSTMLRLLAGHTESDGGVLELGHKVEFHYYAQHQLDGLQPKRTALEELELAAPTWNTTELRKLLGGFLFSGEDVDKPVAVLSGGEKARLALAMMLVRPVNLLLLDEPTNHLDLRSREVLEEALNEYGGTMILVSHDRYFINRVVTSIGRVGEGRIERFDGDYDEYAGWLARRAEEQPPPGSTPRGEAPAKNSREEKRREAEQRNRRYRERREMERKLAPLETEIGELEARLGELTALQSDPAVYADPARAAETGREKSDAESRLKRLYADWESLAAELGEGQQE